MPISRADDFIQYSRESYHVAFVLTAWPHGLALAGCANLVHAAGFALIEQNASGLGNAYAGQAAAATDASTIFFNPAGMTLLPDRQLVVAGHLIKPQAEFSGTVERPPVRWAGRAAMQATGRWCRMSISRYRLTPDCHLGIGVNAPFGLKTEYDARLDRPLSGDQVGSEDDQSQSVHCLEGQRSTCRLARV